MQTYGHLRDKHSADMAQKVVFAEPPPASALANVVALPNASTSNHVGQQEAPATVAKAKAKYSYPWWASESPAEVFWGQVNEAVQIVPVEKYITAAAQAMGREVFKTELNDPQALVAEFLERAPEPILKALSAKISLPRAEDRLAKAG
jgi:phage terminase large subunit-like protein